MPTQAARRAPGAPERGTVSVGLAPTTAAVLGLPLMPPCASATPTCACTWSRACRATLTTMLNARQLDLAVLFETDAARRWSVTAAAGRARCSSSGSRRCPACRETARACASRSWPVCRWCCPAARTGCARSWTPRLRVRAAPPQVALEIDGLAVLMDAVRAGLGATVQPGAVAVRVPPEGWPGCRSPTAPRAAATCWRACPTTSCRPAALACACDAGRRWPATLVRQGAGRAPPFTIPEHPCRACV
jgi:LysR family tcuABC transcriptional regulator